ncbi:MAG: PGF-CTERM sorting domain-containing protein [Halobacteriota archaeon]
MRANLRVIVFACIILLLVVGGVAAINSDLFASGNITLRLLDVKDESDDRVDIRYGDTIKVRAVYPATSRSVQYLDILDRDYHNNLIKRYPLSSTGEDIVNIPASTYAPATNFTLRVYAEQTNETLRTDDLGITILARPSSPVITLSIKNPAREVAKGDNLVMQGSITTTEYTWTVEGPYNQEKFYELAQNASVEGDQQPVNPWDEYATVITDKDKDIEISIPTHTILTSCEGSTGTYSLKVWNAAYPNDQKEVEFQLTDIEVQLSTNKDTIRLGETLKVWGTTNAAPTSSEYDDTAIGKNTVRIDVYDEPGSNSPIASFSTNVKEDGSFEKDIEFPLDWKTGTYEIKANVSTGANYYQEGAVTLKETPQVTPTPTVTPTATATPTVTPTASPTPSPTPTATVSPQPTETPVITPSPTVQPTETEQVDTPGFGAVIALLGVLTAAYLLRRE